MMTSRRGSWSTPWATRRGLAQRQQEPARQHQTRHGSGQGVAWGGRRSEFVWNDVKPQAGVLFCLRSQGLKRLWFEKRLREEWHLSLDAQMLLEIISDPAQSVQSVGGQNRAAASQRVTKVRRGNPFYTSYSFNHSCHTRFQPEFLLKGDSGFITSAKVRFLL